MPRKAVIIDSKVRKFIMSLFFKERAMKQKEVKKLERIVKRDAVYNECLVAFQTSLQFDNQDELASCVCIEKKFGSCPGEKW